MTTGIDSRASQFPLQIQQPSSARHDYSCVLAEEYMGGGKLDKLEYRIMDSKGNLVASVPSSYQLDPGAPDRSLSYAKSAVIYWSSDGSKVALDEENYRFKGEVFIINLSTSPASIIEVPRKTIEEIVGGNLEIYQIRVHRGGWTSPDELRLDIGGYHRLASGVDENFTRFVTVNISSKNDVSVKKIW